MPSYKNDPPDQEYLDSIKKHTDKETNKPETSSTEAASPKVAQPPPKPKLKETKTLEAEKDDMDIVSENLKTHSDKIATEKRGKSSEDDKKKKMQA
ncbi:hypothetical protein E8E15_002600 [Penicillium rubens]|uniref:Uncharacterized protein n=1 Tax=Penicillium chrysogenum TaxID=5076 RepID=A0A161YCY9_PENCH|nr:hypothetical protein E8E15_002600 [Penicillium rubens]KAJ5045022.1 hypothetical protein NUH16_001834 [Penicillium rubens]KZN90495.1 hypothetical protein EN45_006120 [Penicillium chrysogenum]